MTHKQVFLEIGHAFETPVDERSGEQYNIAGTGLCWAIDYLSTDDVVKNMMQAMINEIGRGSEGYWLPICTRESDLARANFCYLLAAMSRKELKELGEE